MEKKSSKSRLVAFLLVFFFGTLGAHRFYVGKNGSGLAMLGLSVTGVGLIVTGVWALLDTLAVLIGVFDDAQGLRVKDWN